MRSRAGFTLLELLITIGAFALIASMAVPSLLNLQQSYALRQAATQLENAVRQTRTLSAAKNQSLLLCIKSASPVSYQIGTNSTASCNNTLTTVLGSDRLTPGLSIALPGSVSTYQLRFTDRGVITPLSTVTSSTTPTLTLSYSGNPSLASRQVVILSVFAKVIHR